MKIVKANDMAYANQLDKLILASKKFHALKFIR